jgi:hypothetical protein
MAPKLCAGVGAIAWVIVEVCAPKHTQTRTINQLGEEQQSWKGVFWLRNRTRSFGDANGFFSKPYVFPRKVIYQTGTISSSRHFFREAAEASCRQWCRRLGDVEVLSSKYTHMQTINQQGQELQTGGVCFG